MSPSWPARLAAMAVLAVVLAATGLLLRGDVVPADSPIGAAISNWGHVPLFAVVALALLAVARRWLPSRWRRPVPLYALVAAAGGLLALVSEVAQIAGPRDAAFVDLFNDGVGIAAALAFRASFERELPRAVSRRGARRALRHGAVLLLAASLVPVALWAEAYRRRAESFPLLCGFDSPWLMRFVETGAAELVRTTPPAAWEAARGEVGRLSVHGWERAGLSIEDPWPDWTGYDELRLRTFLPGGRPVTLVLRIDDRVRREHPADRYERAFTLQPGAGELRVPLAEIAAGPRFRQLDLAHVHLLLLYARRVPEPFVVYLDDLRLWREGTSGQRAARMREASGGACGCGDGDPS
jgi:hypothetical protein